MKYILEFLFNKFSFKSIDLNSNCPKQNIQNSEQT